jgi:serine/threonine protein kinase
MGLELTEGDLVSGRYRLGAMLGEGGMGSVMSATDTETGDRVAIKFLRSEVASDAGGSTARGRFLREIRAVTGLTSRHVAKVISAGELPDGRPFIVMEHLTGKDLARILSERLRLPVEEVVEYMLQACAGLGAAHAEGIVHRDLKPANIFVAGYVGDPRTRTEDDEGPLPIVKVLDFGVSKIIDPDEEYADSVITHVTDMLGSPAYMAPEQLLSAKDADVRSDVYSMGAILYRLLTGELPIKATSFREHVDAIVRGDIVAPIQLVPELPEELSRIIMRCLSKKPDSRYQEVSQLARALLPFSGPDGPVSLERIELVKRAPPDVASDGAVQREERPSPVVSKKGGVGRLVAFAIVLVIIAAGVGAFVASR